MKTWKGDKTLQENLLLEEEITSKISPKEIIELCSLEHHFRWVQDTFKRLGI
jgi:adenylosuccinate lyase